MRYEILRLQHIGRMSEAGDLYSDISFVLYRGEALCLLTEDIDTKNFLFEFFMGKVFADHGDYFIDDNYIMTYGPEEAHKQGLYAVTEQQLIGRMCVADNLYISDPNHYSRLHFFKPHRIRLAAENLLHRFGLDYINPSAETESLSYADRYLLAILKAYTTGAKIIILDNPPVSFLQPSEAAKIQNMIRILTDENVSVLWFSSQWVPFFETFDRCTIISNGVVTKTMRLRSKPPVFPPQNLMRNMIKEKSSRVSNQKLLLNYSSSSGKTIELFTGEILGVCEYEPFLGDCIDLFLQNKPDTDSGDVIFFEGKPWRPGPPVPNTIAVLSSQADSVRIFPDMTLWDNITLLMNYPAYNAAGFVNKRIKRHLAAEALKSIGAAHLIDKYGSAGSLYHMKPTDQWLVEIAKWICLKPKIYIFNHPYSIYENLSETVFLNLLTRLQTLGISVLLISSSEEFLSKFCTRITHIDV